MANDLELIIPPGVDLEGEIAALEAVPNYRSSLSSDVLIGAAPHLAIVTFEQFAKVMDMRLPPGTFRHDENSFVNYRHPLVSKWACPRCPSGTYKIHNRFGLMRCSNALNDECNAPNIDFPAADALLIEAVGMLVDEEDAEGFATRAAQRFREVIATAQSDRKQLQERADHLKEEIKSTVRNMNANKNPLVLESLDELNEEYTTELAKLQRQLSGTRSIPENPDPRSSLLDVRRMLDHLCKSGPINYGRDEETLRLKNSLRDLLVAVRATELGDGYYDLEMDFNAAKLIDADGDGWSVETVILRNRLLHHRTQAKSRRADTLAETWRSQRYALTDSEWEARPELPWAFRMFGTDTRLAINTLILMCECNIGKGAACRATDHSVREHKLNVYKGLEEAEVVQEWLRRIRPREHSWWRVCPQGSSFPTLRERLQEVDHPLLHLDRCNPGAPQPISDEEWAGLFPKLVGTPKRRREMRQKFDVFFTILQRGGHIGRYTFHNFVQWMRTAEKSGNVRIVVEHLLAREGKPCPPVPRIPTGTKKRGWFDSARRVLDKPRAPR